MSEPHFMTIHPSLRYFNLSKVVERETNRKEDRKTERQTDMHIERPWKRDRQLCPPSAVSASCCYVLTVLGDILTVLLQHDWMRIFRALASSHVMWPLTCGTADLPELLFEPGQFVVQPIILHLNRIIGDKPSRYKLTHHHNVLQNTDKTHSETI